MNYFEAEDSWKSNDEWRLADKEAAWKFFFAAGKDAPQKVISAQCVKMNQYENIIFEIRDQLAAAQVENERLENQVLARDAELWGRTQEILGLKDQLAKAEQRVAEACALQVATETKFRWLDAARVAKEIRSGEWRKFVKEV